MHKKPLGTLAAFALAGIIAASPAAAAAPQMPELSVDEGGLVTVPVSHTCGVKKCTYTVEVIDGVATAGSDYTAVAAITGKAKKGRTFSTNVNVATLDDQVVESAEDFTVRVTLTRKGKVATFDAVQMINDNDTPPAPAPAPPGDPDALPFSVPANPPNSFISTNKNNYRSSQSCTTPAAAGAGNVLASCYPYARCPTTVTSCRGSVTETVAASETDDKHFVRAFVHARISDASGFLTDFNATCGAFGTCTTSQDSTALKPGEWLVAECTGTQDGSFVQPGTDRLPEPKAVIICAANVYFP